MQIYSKSQFRSIEPLSPIKIQDFIVITGINGSGKSHLLEGISKKQIQLNENKKDLTSIKYVNTFALSPNKSNKVTIQDFKISPEQIKRLYTEYLQLEKSNQLLIQGPSTDNSQSISLIRQVAEKAKKSILELEENDFYIHTPGNAIADQTDIFGHNLSEIFKHYQVTKDENNFNKYHSEKTGEKISYQSDDEFAKKYGEEPPWDLVNRILDEANLDYKVNSPAGHHRDAPFKLMLINNLNNVEIDFNELSSGEKVIMSLAIALYNSKLEREFPEVLLMDEPDASLHPSMTKQFLDVIQTVFVHEKKMKVLMTTHSLYCSYCS